MNCDTGIEVYKYIYPEFLSHIKQAVDKKLIRYCISPWLNTNQKMLVCGMLQKHICNDY